MRQASSTGTPALFHTPGVRAGYVTVDEECMGGAAAVTLGMKQTLSIRTAVPFKRPEETKDRIVPDRFKGVGEDITQPVLPVAEEEIAGVDRPVGQDGYFCRSCGTSGGYEVRVLPGIGDEAGAGDAPERWMGYLHLPEDFPVSWERRAFCQVAPEGRVHEEEIIGDMRVVQIGPCSSRDGAGGGADALQHRFGGDNEIMEAGRDGLVVERNAETETFLPEEPPQQLQSRDVRTVRAHSDAQPFFAGDADDVGDMGMEGRLAPQDVDLPDPEAGDDVGKPPEIGEIHVGRAVQPPVETE